MTQDSRRLQYEIDFLDKVRAARMVLTAALERHIDDPEAIGVCGEILDHAVNRLQICRINREAAEANVRDAETGRASEASSSCVANPSSKGKAPHE